LLLLTNVFLPNETEALSITHAGDVESAARQLAERSELVAVKLGAEGAAACSQNVFTQSKSISVNVVDTVGAGDTFDAGFIYGYLNHWSIEKSLRLACVCGALSTQKAGGTNGQPTLSEATKFL
jgi:sugar/nucleoside kinase (ribokinase family)